MYVSQIIMLYTLNLYSAVCQLYLNKTGRKITERRDFPGGAVVKNPPANAEDMGSSPGPGRSHMLQSNWAHAPEPTLCNKRSHRNEKPAHRNKE